MSDIDDFLSVTDPAKELVRKTAEQEFASHYVSAFVNNPSGAVLLAYWTQVYAKRRTPVNAPHTEYAANEAMRAFIEGLHDQISIARKGV